MTMLRRMPRGSVSPARFGWSEVAFLVLVILVAGALNLRLPRSLHPGWFLLFLPIIVGIHEAGHAVASLLLGHRVLEVAIGAGPSLRFNVGRTRIQLGALPVSGHVASGSTTVQGFRWKRSVIIVAGPAMNALMFGVGVLWLPSSLLHAFAIVNAFVLINNLLPFSQQTPLGSQANDGLALVRTLFDPAAELEEQRVGMTAAEAQRLAELGDRDGASEMVRQALVIDPHSRILRNWLGHNLVFSGRVAEARGVFKSLVEDDERRDGPVPRERSRTSSAIHLNNLAWADLMLDDSALIAEANVASARAIELLPGHPAIWGTRAFALIVTSHFGEGIALARKAFKKDRNPTNRALQACVLAIGYARNWRFDDAERWLALAIGLDPRCALLQRVTRELGARRTPAPDPASDAG